jgi:hypothetical protein
LSVLKVITRREGGGRVLGVHGAGSVQDPGSPHSGGLGVFRWVVERTLAWLHCFRCLALRYERRADFHEAFLTLGCALTDWRYLKKEF